MIAVVIPYFKKTFFNETLSSLVNQTNKNFRVYVGDDASSEDPVILINEYQEKLPLKYHRFEENLGLISLARQWERCVSLTNDEPWIMILGDDDYLEKNCIEEFYNHLSEINRREIQVVRFATRIITPPNNNVSGLFTHPVIELASDAFYRKFFKHSRGSLSEQIFRREAYLRSGFRNFPLGWGADNFAWLDFTNFGYIYTINAATIFFRISNQNISRAGYQENLKAKAKFHYFSILIEKHLFQFKPYQQEKILLLYEWLAYSAKNITIEFYSRMVLIHLRKMKFLELIKFHRRVFLLYPKR